MHANGGADNLTFIRPINPNIQSNTTALFHLTNSTENPIVISSD